MELTFLLIIIALIFLVIASYSDLKTREVPDWLNFSLVGIALFSRLAFSIINNDESYLLGGITYFFIFFILANIFYYTKIFAGGDAKLLMAIGTVVASPPNFLETLKFKIAGYFNFPFSFLLNLLFIAALYGFSFSLFYAYKNKRRFMEEFKKENNKLKTYLFFIGIFIFIISILLKYYFMGVVLLIVLTWPYLHLFLNIVEKVSMTKEVSVNKLTEGDWLAKEVRINRRIIKPRWEGLTKEEIRLIKKNKKKVLVKYGIPFVPVFLLSFLVSLIIGNLFEFVLSLL